MHTRIPAIISTMLLITVACANKHEGTTTTTEATTQEEETTSTTGMVGCAGLEETACAADKACMRIDGQKVDEDSMCVEKLSFLECVKHGACAEEVTSACPKGSSERWQFPTACIPDGYEPCPGQPLDEQCP